MRPDVFRSSNSSSDIAGSCSTNNCRFGTALGSTTNWGGVCCSLGYDGARLNDEKFVWFQGRGLWVYSFLYNHLKADPAYLEVARKTKEFLLAHAPQPDGTWASKLSREGRVLAPESALYGRYFAIEGFVACKDVVMDDFAWRFGCVRI